MASGVRLYSTEALADFVTGLGRFSAVARDDLVAVEDQLRRVAAYLQERRADALREVERCEDEVRELSSLAGDEDDEDAAQAEAEAEAELAEAGRRLEEAEDRLRETQLQAARVEEASAAFRRVVKPLEDLLADGTSRATAFLVSRQDAIERYLMLAARGAAAAGGAAAASAASGGARADAGLVGTPVEDAQYWHYQGHCFSCAIVAQEQVIRKRTGEPVTEAGLTGEAALNGWWEGTGTQRDHLGNLCRAHGLQVERVDWTNGMNLDRLREHIAQGRSVIVGVDSRALAGRAGQSSMGHAVWVTGIDDEYVYMNDSGVDPGARRSVPVERFTKAWDLFGNLAVICSKP